MNLVRKKSLQATEDIQDILERCSNVAAVVKAADSDGRQVTTNEDMLQALKRLKRCVFFAMFSLVQWLT